VKKLRFYKARKKSGRKYATTAVKLLNRFGSGLGTNMRKAVHPSGGMGSSNPRRWRGERHQHHGDVVCHVVCAFCVVSDS